MRYIIHIHIDETELIYPINARDEDEAKERLLLRLPPQKRENLRIDMITIDPKSIVPEDPYGIFDGE